MKRYIVLGVNENPKYQYYIPIVYWAWRRIGWEPLLFYSGDLNDKALALIVETFDLLHADMTAEMKLLYSFKLIPFQVHGYGSDTIAQVSRLFAASVEKDASILMTSDCDMLPLSDYWKPMDYRVTCYGRDLTDYHYPICYVAANPFNWIKIMLLTDESAKQQVKNELDLRNKKTNPWLWDQDILTERLNAYGKNLITRIDRGSDFRTGYPIGRVDRSNWTLDHKILIDAHLPHDILTNEQSFKKVLDLLHHCWPGEDWKWFVNYHKEFKKLL